MERSSWVAETLPGGNGGYSSMWWYWLSREHNQADWNALIYNITQGAFGSRAPRELKWQTKAVLPVGMNPLGHSSPQ